MPGSSLIAQAKMGLVPTPTNPHSQILLPDPYLWCDGAISFWHGKRIVIYSPFSGAFLRTAEDVLARGRKLTSGQIALLEKDAFIFRPGRQCLDAPLEDRVSLTIAPTMKCNLTCGYCFQGSYRGESSLRHSSFTDEIVSYIASKTASKRVVDIEWFGGEPLIAHRDILAVSTRLHELGVDFRSTLVTNGVLFHLLQDDFCQKARLHAVQVTLDGGRVQHDQVRTGKNYPGGTFDQVVRAVHWFLQHDVHVTVRVNVGAMNLCDADKVVEQIASCFQVGHALSFYAEQYDAERWLLEAVAASHRIEDGLEYLGFNLKGTPIKSFSCGAMDKSHAVIGPDLAVYSCYNEIGDLSKAEGHIDTGATTGRYEKFSVPEPCRKCSVQAICFGRGCPSLAAKDSFQLNESVCDLIRDRIMAGVLKEYAARYGVSM